MAQRVSRFERDIRRRVSEGDDDFFAHITSLRTLGWVPAVSLLIKLYGILDGANGMPEYRSMCLEVIGSLGGRRARSFLIAQLELHKSDWLGDWAIIGLCRGNCMRLSDVEMFVHLLEDPDALISTKESAVKGLSNHVERIGWGKRYALEPVQVKRLEEIAKWALEHEHPEMRVSGIWLATQLGTCGDRIRELAKIDHAQAFGGTVSEEASCHGAWALENGE